MSDREKKQWVKYLETIIEIAGILVMVAPLLLKGGKRRKK